MRLIDVHCHCLPGLDDGPAAMEEALALCRQLEAEGVSHVVATPHQLGGYGLVNDAVTVRRAAKDLQARLSEAGVDLVVLPGGDVRMDERIPEYLDEDTILTIGGGGSAVLLEPPDEPGVDPIRMGEALLERGLLPVLTHPERTAWLRERGDILARWLEAVGAIQVTAGSLIGGFGRNARDAAWTLLEHEGGILLVASDAHDLSDRAPCWAQAGAAIAGHFGPDAAYRLCAEEPGRLLGVERPSWLSA